MSLSLDINVSPYVLLWFVCIYMYRMCHMCVTAACQYAASRLERCCNVPDFRQRRTVKWIAVRRPLKCWRVPLCVAVWWRVQGGQCR